MKKHFACVRDPFSVKKTVKTKDLWDVMLQKCALISWTVGGCFYWFGCQRF